MFKHFLKIVTICTISFWAAHGAAYDPSDPRHQLVSGIKNTFAVEILERKTRLGTNYSSVAIVDFARERLESGNFTPSEPDWSLIVRYVLLGYGYKSGVIDVDALTETSRPSAAEIEIMEKGWALSSAYFYARGIDCTVDASQVYTLSASPACIENHVQQMNQVTAAVPSDVHTAVQGVVNRLQELSKLSSFNAWFAHERFWAVSGVIDPNAYAKQREMYALHTGTPVTFLDGLSRQLEQTIRALSVAGVPAADVIEDLVRQSQRILLTIAAGTPTAEGYTRLVPANIADWQTIRKALFLALSVTSNPDQADTYLSTLFDCAVFYPEKTEPDEIKSYYWKIQALAKSFSSLWAGLKAGQADAALNVGLQQVVAAADPMSGFVLPQGTPYRGSSWTTLKRSYEEAIALVQSGIARSEISASLTLAPHLNFTQVFQTLYPDLMTWVEHHIPSQRAQDFVGIARTKMVVPAGFDPQRIHLVYAGGKWSLKGMQGASEHTFWTQGVAASVDFTGELTNARGTHLFSFSVNGALATIKVISAGYVVNVVGDGARVSVANGNELGIIESSAYPMNASIYSNEADASILIKGRHYSGSQGILVSHRDSVWVHTPEIDLSGKEKSDISQGIITHKDAILYSNVINLLNSKIIAGQDAYFSFTVGLPYNYLYTHGSEVYAGNTICTNTGDWFVDSHTVWSGYPNPPRTRSGILTPEEVTQYQNSVKTTFKDATIDYGRFLQYTNSYMCVANENARNVLFGGAHVYGLYKDVDHHLEPYSFSEVKPVILKNQGPVRSPFPGIGITVSGKPVSGILAPNSPIQAAMQAIRFDRSNSSGGNTRLQNLELGISNSGGNTSFSGNVSVTSAMGDISLGSTTMGFNYKTGDSGRSIDLYSTHVPTSFADSIRIGAATGINTASITTPSLMMHMAASNAILQLTDRQGKMNVGTVLDKTYKAYKVLRGVRSATTTGASSTTSGRITATEALIKGFKETYGLDEEEKNSDAKSSSSNTTTGGGMGEDPDDPKKDRKTNCGKSESPVWKEFKPHQGKLKTDGDKIYDWDHTHNDIEAYNSRGEHVGTIDPVTGIKIKDAVAGRKINV